MTVFFIFPFALAAGKPQVDLCFLFLSLGPWDLPFQADNLTSISVLFQKMKQHPADQIQARDVLWPVCGYCGINLPFTFSSEKKGTHLCVDPLNDQGLHTPVEPA